jgi:hypothetical protein
VLLQTQTSPCPSSSWTTPSTTRPHIQYTGSKAESAADESKGHTVHTHTDHTKAYRLQYNFTDPPSTLLAHTTQSIRHTVTHRLLHSLHRDTRPSALAHGSLPLPDTPSPFPTTRASSSSTTFRSSKTPALQPSRHGRSTSSETSQGTRGSCVDHCSRTNSRLSQSARSGGVIPGAVESKGSTSSRSRPKTTPEAIVSGNLRSSSISRRLASCR